MSLARAPLRFLAKIMISLVRGLAEAIGRLANKSELWALRLLLVLTPVAIAYSLFLRLALHITVPAVVWLVLTAAWLAGAFAWLLGGLVWYVALHPHDRPLTRGRRRSSPGPQRIQDWDASWRQALRHEQAARHRTACGGQYEHHHHEPPAQDVRLRSPHEILEIDPDAGGKQIRAAYRRLAQLHHPDHNPGFARQAAYRFAEIQAAYELLSAHHARAGHDRQPP